MRHVTSCLEPVALEALRRSRTLVRIQLEQRRHEARNGVRVGFRKRILVRQHVFDSPRPKILNLLQLAPVNDNISRMVR